MVKMTIKNSAVKLWFDKTQWESSTRYWSSKSRGRSTRLHHCEVKTQKCGTSEDVFTEKHNNPSRKFTHLCIDF